MKKYNSERIKYSVLGKKWSSMLKGTLVMGSALSVLFFLMVAICFAWAGRWWIVPPTITVIGIIVYIRLSLEPTLRSLQILSMMSEREFEELIAEYNKYKNENLTAFGMLTKYGIVLDDGLAPWQNIVKIEFLPLERRHYRNRTETVPPRMVLTLVYEDKRKHRMTQSFTTEFDVSEKIDAYIESLSDYTEYKYEVHNEYYFEN